MLDPQHAQHVLTQHRSLHAGAGSALVESTADNAGATLGIMFGHERYLVFWIDYCNLFQRPGDQGSSYFSIMHQGVKRLDLRSYMNSRPCETLQLAQVDLLLQQNMPGLQDKKVQHPSQSECHFIMFSNSF